MDAGDQDVLTIQHRSAVSADHAIFQAHIPLSYPSKAAGDAVSTQRCGDGIVGIDHQNALFILMAIDILLCLHILIHILVDIQMVGRKIGNHRHPGTVGHIHQLERAKLHHSHILFFHLPGKRQQGRADVAAQPDRLSLFL